MRAMTSVNFEATVMSARGGMRVEFEFAAMRQHECRSATITIRPRHGLLNACHPGMSRSVGRALFKHTVVHISLFAACILCPILASA